MPVATRRASERATRTRHLAERLQNQQTGDRLGSRPSAAGGGGATASACVSDMSDSLGVKVPCVT
jgi:hypothetical protein